LKTQLGAAALKDAADNLGLSLARKMREGTIVAIPPLGSSDEIDR